MAEPLRQRSRILGSSLFAALDDVVPGFGELAFEAGRIDLVDARRYLLRHGAEVDRLIVPLSAPLRLLRPDGTNESEVGTHGKLEILAMRELLHGEPCSVSAVTAEPTLVLSIGKADFIRHVRRFPHVLAFLDAVATSPAFRSLQAFMTGRGLAPEQMVALARALSPVQTIDPGVVIGLDGGQLCLVDSGLLHGESPSSGQSWRISTGMWFGGESLVSPYRASYEVRGVSPARVRHLRLKDISHVLDAFDLIGPLRSEPGMPRPGEAIAVRPGRPARAGTVLRWNVDLPGDPVPEAEARAMDVLPASRLRAADTDADSHVASIVNLTTLLDVDVNPAAIEQQLADTRALTVVRVAQVLEPCGLLVRGLQSSWHELGRQTQPALFVFGTRLCVLLAKERAGVVAHDPVRGIIRISARDLETHWDGVLIAAERASLIDDLEDDDEATAKGSRDEPGRRRALVRRLFSSELAPMRGLMANVVLLSLVLIGTGLLIPRISQEILDEVLTLRDLSSLRTYVVAMGLIILFNTGLSVARSLVLSELGYRVDYRFTSRFYRHALSLPMTFFGDRRAGDVLSRMHEVTILRRFFSTTSVDALMAIAQLVIFAGVLLFYSVKVAALALALLPLILLIRLAFAGRLRRAFNAVFRFSTRSQSLLGEQISSIATIKAAGGERAARERWEQAFVGRVEAGRRALVTESTISNLNGLLARVMEIAGIWLAASIALDGKLSPGEIFAVTSYLSQAVNATLRIGAVVTDVEEMRVAADKLGHVLLAEPEEPPERVTRTMVARPRGTIRLDKVSFRYQDDLPWVLRDVDVTIYPRQIVALVGRSGCGKTTLANIIAGNLQPTSGRLLFDDLDAAFLSMGSLRKKIGLISQDSTLFAGSIVDNVAYSDDSPDLDDVASAADNAAALEFIQRMPGRFDTQLAVGGLGLSGGQRQRTSIARTLYTEPSILVMDEATSSLDAATEAAVLGRMHQILRGKTAIVIAHRLSTVRAADRILVMKDGRIVEDGSHAELMQRGGHYFELFENQT